MSVHNDYGKALDYLRLLARQMFADWWADAARGAVTVESVADVFTDLVVEFGEQASFEAVDYLIMSRSLDDELAGLPVPERSDPVGLEQARSSFEWAVNTSRQAGKINSVVAGAKLDRILDRLVALPAHETVVKNVVRDGTAFARVPEPGACAFCLMLASRGAVYTRETVGAVNKYHDGCRCLGIEVKRDGSDLPQINRELQELWDSSGSNTQADFRLALNTRREFASFGHPLNTEVYRLVDESVRASIVRWQGMDRFYAKVQKAAEGDVSDREAMKVRRDLVRAAKETPLQKDVLMWRGVRNWKAAFGSESLQDLKNYDQEQARFTAISADKKIAEEEFTSFGKAGALLKIKAKRGTRGIWMPTNGDELSELCLQQEFLIPPGARVKVLSVHSDDLPMIEVEISNE